MLHAVIYTVAAFWKEEKGGGGIKSVSILILHGSKEIINSQNYLESTGKG
jgi:hypothetical protein